MYACCMEAASANEEVSLPPQGDVAEAIDLSDSRKHTQEHVNIHSSNAREAWQYMFSDPLKLPVVNRTLCL